MHLIISQSQHPLFQVPLNNETISIGRGIRNDISLADPFVSRNHALIRKENKKWTITDRSQNGIIVDGKKAQTFELQAGTCFKIGSYTFECLTQEQEQEDTKVTKLDQPTQMLSYQENEGAVVVEQVWLEQIQPIKRKFKITKALTTIGKDLQNDIMVQDDYISNFHCKITQKDNGFILTDLGSTNGTLVNQQKMMEAPLSPNAQITLGKAVLIFHTQKENKKIIPKSENQFCGLVSNNEKMKKIFSFIEVVAPTDASVFISGETGTGKELIARAVYEKSNRFSKPFISINCGAISKDLIESELFGHEKGAFTSAHQQRLGLFEQANGGTLFLDEIGELPLDLQPKLLRVLETGEIRRVGGDQGIHVDVRIICATHRDLFKEVEQNRFREDLLYRLFVIPITLPPLRERKEDIELLSSFLLEQNQQKFKQSKKTLSPEALTKLQNHNWPGNIRELKNILQRSLIVSHQHSQIEEEHIEFLGNASPENFTGVTLEEIERNAIEKTLKQCGGNKTLTAQTLGIAKSTLHLKVQQYKL